MGQFKISITIVFAIACFLSCNEQDRGDIEVLRSYSLDSIDEVITREWVEIDKETSTDRNGSLKITVDKPTVIKLFETGDVDVENSQIVYKAKLKSEALEGEAYLEMWCSFLGKGDYFSRSLNSTVKGTMSWVEITTPFFLKKGENPDNVRLNLVVNGKGIVWIDEIDLIKTPLN